MSKPLKLLADVKYGKSPNDVRTDQSSIPIYGTSGIVGCASRGLFQGEGAVVGRKGTLDKPIYVTGDYWVIDTAYAVAPFQDVDAKWLYYNLASYDLVSLNEATGVPSINRDYLYRIEFVTPSYPEQRKIAKILSTVDNLIEKTQALIDKYQSIKQGMMHDLFTCGVDEHGQLRPSYKEAPHLYKESELGWRPKEWEVVNLGSIADKITSGSRGWAPYYAEDGDLFMRIGNLTREHINFRFDDVVRVALPKRAEGARTQLEAGDLLISITADLGIVGVVPTSFETAYVNQHIALVRCSHYSVNQRWLGHFLASKAGQLQFERLNDSGAKAGLNLPTVGALRIAQSSKREQDVVQARLDQIDGCIHKYKLELSKLRSLKSGLMQDLLTGKVRVNTNN